MSRLLAPLGALVLVGCYSETDYVVDKTEAFCVWAVACTDEATQAFDGLDASSCQGTWGPAFAEEGATCRKFKSKIAKQCVDAITLATCPEDGSPVAENMPEICTYVYERCETLGSEEPEPEPTGE